MCVCVCLFGWVSESELGFYVNVALIESFKVIFGFPSNKHMQNLFGISVFARCGKARL